MTRRAFLATAAAIAPPLPAARSSLGVLLYSFGIRVKSEKGLADPLAFLAFCHERGGAGVQISLGRREDAEAAKVARRADALEMYVEGIVRAPADKADVERFDGEIRTAKACGADVVRTVMM